MLNNSNNKHYICSVLIVVVMFVRIKTTGKNQYLQIVENHREGTKVKQHILGTLGRVDQIVGTKEIDGLIAKLSRYTQEALMVITGQSEIQAYSSSIGGALIFERLWNELQIPSIIHKLIEKRKFTFDVERAIFLTVLHRLFESGSDRQCVRWKNTQQVSGKDDLSLHHLYRAMYFLGEETEDQLGHTPFANRCIKDVIEEKLFERRADLFSGLSMVFFDTTSIYFEGDGGEETGSLGHSKDHRPDLHQMIVGAILNENGEPICCELWPGNTADVSSLIPVVDRMRVRFGISEFCIVADRGMISEKTIAQLEKRKINYILGVRMRKMKLVRDEILSRAGRFEEVRYDIAEEEHDPLKVKEVWFDDRRYIICKNERQARKDEATRNAIIESLEEKLQSGAKTLIGNKGFKKYLVVKRNSVTIDKAKIEEEKRFDGKWVLTTSTTLPAAEVALQYKELWQVEQVFRDMKSILDTRPVYHQLDETIKGHVFCSFLALVLRKELEKRLEASNLCLEWNDIKRDLMALQEVVLEESNNKKIAIRTAPQGTCTSIFRAVGVALPPTLRQIA
jgi:transposase